MPLASGALRVTPPRLGPKKTLKERRTTYEGSGEAVIPGVTSSSAFTRSTFVTESRVTESELWEKYSVGEELGSGATAIVYRAVKRRTDEEVAMKIIEKDRITDAKMLRNEIQIHKATDHPNVLRLLEVFEDDEKLYLVTEICRGGDLWKYLTANENEYSVQAIPEQEALQIVQQVIDSVLYLHSCGVVHRDLKPSNFIFSSSHSVNRDSGTLGRIVKLADFGVSAICGSKHRLTKRVGTDGFMAPEVMRNQPYNEKADIFSIGCILHMMLTGYPPKVKDNGEYSISKVRLRFISEEMLKLVEWFMQPKPEDRPSAWEAYQLPALMKMRSQGWANSARLDVQLLDNMYAYSSFPLLKKAALVAMVSRAESDFVFSRCIAKFMSLEQGTSGIGPEDMYKCLHAELVDDVGSQARKLVSSALGSGADCIQPKPCRLRRNPLGKRRQRREAAEAGAASPIGDAAKGLERFQSDLLKVAEELVHRMDVSDSHRVSYSEWLAATVDFDWYADSQRITNIFRLFDVDSDGIISHSDLKRVLPDVFNKLEVEDVLLESQHCHTDRGVGMRQKDFALLLQTHRPSSFTLRRMRSGMEDALRPQWQDFMAR